MTAVCASTKWAPRFLIALVGASAAACQHDRDALVVSAGETFAELRAIKGDVTVTPGTPGDEARRAPYPRERISEGEIVQLAEGGLAWLRRDAGAVLLVAGPARLTLRHTAVELTQGRTFVDTNGGPPAAIDTPRGPVVLSDARASAEVLADGTAAVYVLRGSARASSGGRAGPGERLTVGADGASTRTPEIAWDDWTGGLATADPPAEPAPFGLGTVGARPAGDQGKARFSLVVQRLDVRVTVDHDFAVTEVDETFVNPTAAVVEGIFSFRTPPGAVLQRFGVDRNGDLVWGRVKESAAALEQYQSNVYAGSTEDPALLQWMAPGAYSARLYPIHPGSRRRVVTRYAEWLPRQGPAGERRLYVYPMAAEGARESLPRIEELTVRLDLSKAGAQRVRSGMGGRRDGDEVVIKAFDVVPLADLAVELFDGGQTSPIAYRAPHGLTADDAPEHADTDFAAKVSKEEADYLLVPLRTSAPSAVPPGMDLAVVVDTSAATEAGALDVARSLTSALLSQLGAADRAAVWAGDATLHPVAEGSGTLASLDAPRRRAWLEGLAKIERGGATDIGAQLTEAASRLDPKRRGAVIYIGDGQPSVGEVAPKALRDRLGRLPDGTRVFAVALGSTANVSLLQSVARGAQVEVVHDAYGAARAALRLLEAAARPTWVGATVDLGPGVERILPHELPAVGPDEAVLVVGRIAGAPPGELTLHGSSQTLRQPLIVLPLADSGDLRRRWGEQRLAELIDAGAGRAAIVDVSRRFGLVSPFTSLYVPTTREIAAAGELASLDDARESRLRRWKPWWRARMSEAEVAAASDAKEGGTGTRAKGEEGSMGNPNAKAAGVRYGIQGPGTPLGILGALGGKDDFASSATASLMATAAASAAPAPPPAAAEVATAVPGKPVGGNAGDPLQLPAAGGGGGRGEGIGLGNLGGIGRGAAATVPPSDALREAKERLDDAKQRLTGMHTSRADHHDDATTVTDRSSPSPPSATSSPTALAVIGHQAHPCSAGADLAFDERRVLWRERLGATGTAAGALDVYRRALSDCEAPTWRERHALLLEMVNHLGSVREKVALWRGLLGNSAAADVVYRATVVRVQTAAELHELHVALGLRSVDPDLFAGLLSRAKTPLDRLAVLRSTALHWPDDMELGLRVLDAYEDAGDDAGGRAWARRLRHRADATPHVYTNVGEYYLRLSARQSGAAATRDADEARRTFGELVEFAPEDPVARRRLGDLLRAHGWYQEAFRQYETLAQLTPDDASVPLLLAEAAQGMGRVEEAVSWAEKAASAGSPDGSSPLSMAARAAASAFLAWALDEATKAGRKEEADRLRARAKRVAGADAAPSGHVRFLAIWSHPELHPVLWTATAGGAMPAADSFPLFGVTEAVVPASPTPSIELRLDPEDAERAARLGARAVVTALVEEGTPAEHVARLDIGFGDAAHPTLDVRITLDHGALRAEAM